MEYCRRNNLVLLSDTPKFLSDIIDGSDTPFIYEKVGCRIDNYLLDEFQDTSRMQWSNFRPLSGCRAFLHGRGGCQAEYLQMEGLGLEAA